MGFYWPPPDHPLHGIIRMTLFLIGLCGMLIVETVNVSIQSCKTNRPKPFSNGLKLRDRNEPTLGEAGPKGISAISLSLSLSLLVGLFKVAKEYVSKWGQPHFMMLSRKSRFSDEHQVIFRRPSTLSHIFFLFFRVDLQNGIHQTIHLREIYPSLPTKNSG